MKTKGITFWEQHVEHFVLGGAAVFLLAFIAWQVLSNPNTVEQGNTKVGPGDIDDMLVEKAEEVRRRLADDAAPGVEIPDHAPIENKLTAMLGESISGRTRMVALAPEADFGEDFGGATEEDVIYVVPQMPAPDMIFARQDFDALADGVLDEVSGLEELFPAEPYDVSFVTVAAVLPLGAARDAYASPGGEGESKIPAGWYGESINVLDVRLEREEYVDGTWENRTTLEVPPGFETLRETIAEEFDSGERDELIEELGMGMGGLQGSILQPPFYPLKLDTWSAPDPRAEAAGVIDESMTDDQRLVARKRKDLANKQRDRQSKIDTAKADGCSIDINRGLREDSADEDRRERERPGRSGGDSGRRGGGGGGGGAPPGSSGGIGFGPDGESSGGEDFQRSCDRLQQAVTRLNEQIRRLQEELEELTGEAIDDTGDAGSESMDAEEIRVWGFDIQAEAGRTYRYRFVVDYYNPFFGKRLNLVEAQESLADTVYLRSEPSAWTEPMTAILPMKVFVTKASGSDARNSGRLGMGTATAEVYRFYSGRWWMETFPVQPGDRVGTVEDVDGTSIDYGSDWFVLDILDVVGRSDENLSATVTLQNLRDDTLIVVHDPAMDLEDEERSELQGKIRDAEAAVAGLAADG